MAEQYEVEGIVFDTKEMADKARQEVEAIQYIRSRTDLKKPELVDKLYHNLIDKQVFETAIGARFIKELEEQIEIVNKKEVAETELEQMEKEVKEKERIEARKKRTEEQRIEYQRTKRKKIEKKREMIMRLSLIFNVILLLAVGAMFYIAKTGNNVNIINYENRIIDRYEAWEQELEEREEALKEKENSEP